MGASLLAAVLRTLREVNCYPFEERQQLASLGRSSLADPAGSTEASEASEAGSGLVACAKSQPAGLSCPKY